MDMFDEAIAISGMLKLCSKTQKKLAEEMGVSQSYIANKLRLLGFSDEMKSLIRSSGISERHARALLRITSEERQRAILEKVATANLTVRECEALVDAERECEIPKMIGEAERHRRTNLFIDSLKSSVDALTSLGTKAGMRKSYYGNKMYITISIEDV